MNEISENNPHEIFIKTLKISDYKGFKACEKEDLSDAFSVEFCTPNGTMGSGLTTLLGDNNCGKTTVLDAINLAVLRSNMGLQPKQHIYNDIHKDIKIVFRMTSDAVYEKIVSHAEKTNVLDAKTGNTFVGGEIFETEVYDKPFTAPKDLYEKDKGRFGYFWARVYHIYKERREKTVILEKIQTDTNCSFRKYMDRRDFTIPSQSGGIGNVETGIRKQIAIISKHIQTDDENSKIFHESTGNSALLLEHYFRNPEERLKIEQERKYDTSGNGALIFASVKDCVKRCEKQRPDKTSYYEKKHFPH